jgi:type II secretory pathway component GspD/PulD (secretin)
MKKDVVKKYLFWVLLFLSLTIQMLVAQTEAQAQTELKIITLQHRFPQDILPAVQPLVGDDGSVSAVQNFLIVRTGPENMRQIEQLIASLDTAQKNIRITISHDSQVLGMQRNISGSASMQTGDVQVNISIIEPNKDGMAKSHGLHQSNAVEFGIGQGELESYQSGQAFITVLDGQRAFIRVGESVPFTQQWLILTQRYPNIVRTTEFRDITTGFAVRPRYVGDQVEVEITPRIASLNASGVIDFEQLSTVVSVIPGKWLDIGGVMQSRDDISRTILSYQQGKSDRHQSLLIKVE